MTLELVGESEVRVVEIVPVRLAEVVPVEVVEIVPVLVVEIVPVLVVEMVPVFARVVNDSVKISVAEQTMQLKALIVFSCGLKLGLRRLKEFRYSNILDRPR